MACRDFSLNDHTWSGNPLGVRYTSSPSRYFVALRNTTQVRYASGPLYYQVFDVLSLDGESLVSRPLLERKALLAEILSAAGNPRLRYVSHVVGNGAEFFKAADGLGLEGIVSKRVESLYRPGERSRDWLKVKCFRTTSSTSSASRAECRRAAGCSLPPTRRFR